MKRFYTLLALMSITITLSAQSDLVGIRNSSLLGGFAYCEIDLVNDTIVDKTLLPGYIGSLYISSTTDPDHSIFYACDGVRIFGVNTLTDSLVLNLPLPVTGNDKMTTIQYNPCDSLIYGLITNSGFNGNTNVCKFNPADSTFTTLVAATSLFHSGQQGAVDPVNNLYIFENGSTSTSLVGGYDIATDQISFNTPVNGFLFRGISYDCASAQVVGLEIHNSPAECYLSSLNTLTGALTQITTSPASGSFYFALGGAALNHVTGNFYYCTSQSTITNLDSLGNFVVVDSLSSNGVTAIETMTACPCPVALGMATVTPPSEISVFPNPCSDVLNLQVEENCTMSIFNSTGQLVAAHPLTAGANSIDMKGTTSGFYFYQINQNGTVRTGSFVKE